MKTNSIQFICMNSEDKYPQEYVQQNWWNFQDWLRYARLIYFESHVTMPYSQRVSTRLCWFLCVPFR